MADLDSNVYYDAVDWQLALRNKDKELKKQKEQIVRLQKLVDLRDDQIRRLKRDCSNKERSYEDLREDYSRIRKRLHWIEKKEMKHREERHKRAKKERQQELKEEIKMKVRIEEEERSKVREELHLHQLTVHFE